ncbi:MAG: hypothetical protein EYC70_16630 [Planctomycetota bacterium]|nr:MAG: hypothetical protein EYC70_16630 [Planctomycetota bacterium]
MSAPADRYPAPAQRYLPAGYQAERWEDIAPWYAELEARDLRKRGELERWILDRGELEAFVSAAAARRNVANACHTDDAEAERRHLEFQVEVLAEVKNAADRLDRKYLACGLRRALDSARWQVYDRDVELSARLFRPENVGLEAQEERLCVQYGALSGGLTVPFRGRTHTLPELARYLEDPDRATREAAWRAGARRRLLERERYEELFDQLLRLRVRMAANAGFASYRDFRHAAYGRFDYTPQDCLALHENIHRHVLPVLQRMWRRRRERLGLAFLRPWDLAVDLEQRPPFQPFQDQAGQVAVAAAVLERVQLEFGQDLRWMEQRGLLDLQTRPHKRPGGFLEHFEDERVPFIFGSM